MSYIDIKSAVGRYNMNITGVIHVGGHFGTEYDLYREIGSIDKIAFFEPDEDSYTELVKKTSHDKKVSCFKKALGPFTGTAIFHRSPDCLGMANSILTPHIVKDLFPSIVFTNTTTVEVEPLDKFEFDESYNFLNMDVQGSELNVLLGASNTLNNIQYITTEVNTAELYRNCALMEDLDYFLGKYNFKRVETGLEVTTQTWGDALYIKNYGN